VLAILIDFRDRERLDMDSFCDSQGEIEDRVPIGLANTPLCWTSWGTVYSRKTHFSLMSSEAEERLMKPIVNACFPGMLAALNLTVFGIIDIRGTPSVPARFTLLFGTIAFVLSSFSIFFRGMYPSRKSLWTAAAVTFLAGLFSSFVAIVLLVVWPP